MFYPLIDMLLLEQTVSHFNCLHQFYHGMDCAQVIFHYPEVNFYH